MQKVFSANFAKMSTTENLHLPIYQTEQTPFCLPNERAKLKISTVQHWRHKIVYTLFKYIITYFGIKIKYFAVLCRSMSVGNKDCCFFQQIQFNNHCFKLRTTAEAKKISAVKVCSEKGFLKIDFSQETFIGGKVPICKQRALLCAYIRKKNAR